MTRRSAAARATNASRGTVLAGDLELAESFRAKLLGLMFRAGLADDAGMWLPGSPSIHMLFMRFPIDCVFVGETGDDGTRPVVGLRRSLQPWTGVVWWVRGGKGTLELPEGTIDRTGTAVGDRVTIDR